jgi:hypothetical protein
MESEEKLGWSLSPAGNVVITMTPEDWKSVLILLGSGSQSYSGGVRSYLMKSLALLNRLNAGNPNYTAYEIKCHWCAEGRPFIPGQEGLQHVPLYGGGEHGGAMCYNSPIYQDSGAADPAEKTRG